jgi:hypothetical protein
MAEPNKAYENIFKSFTGGGWNELKKRYGGALNLKYDTIRGNFFDPNNDTIYNKEELDDRDDIEISDENEVPIERLPNRFREMLSATSNPVGEEEFYPKNPSVGEEDESGNPLDIRKGGAKRKTKTSSGNVKIVEVDVFKIYQSSVGKTGGRYMAQSPYIAAGRAANRLFSTTSGNSLNFVLQKTTRGSNNKYYAYTATRTLLKNPLYVFKKDEKGNRIYMPVEGKPIRVNSSGTILNLVGSKKMTYNPKEGMRESYNVEPFDWEKYLIKKVQQKVKVEATELPSSLKNKYEDEVQAKKEKSKDEKAKERMKNKKLLEKGKAAEKKALMAEKKAAKKLKEQEKKEKAKEKKAKEQMRTKKLLEKGKAAEKKALMVERKAAKMIKEQEKHQRAANKKAAKKMMFGGCGGFGSCTL